ncbi:membrane protein [Aliidongia dinghuensis]|uniref:Membrane protein n=1 Tax=Aliidongia dinghuensis TaxID=1867774 RepID=A0A8J2YQR2_9PROT|nr:CbtA family protein [Aliidongia dinghuensis]GGF09500.1 membrane protein [Aliidongia dinghuensis]
MVGNLILRGLFVGLVAGLLAFGFAKFVGEPQVDKAIAFEAQMDAAKGQAPDEEIVSREVQSSVGLLTGVVVYGTAIGGLFALVFAFASGRVGRLGPRGLSALLALAGFLAIVLVPQLKYPANPPSVGDPETIRQRTALFFIMIAASIALMIGMVNLGLGLKRRLGTWNATLAAAAVYVVAIAAIQLLLPDVNEVPQDFPAVVLWRFREASLGLQIVLWAGIGLGFGWLTERSQRRQFPFARHVLS